MVIRYFFIVYKPVESLSKREPADARDSIVDN
jgi:hypothetical protein